MYIYDPKKATKPTPGHYCTQRFRIDCSLFVLKAMRRNTRIGKKIFCIYKVNFMSRNKKGKNNPYFLSDKLCYNGSLLLLFVFLPSFSIKFFYIYDRYFRHETTKKQNTYCLRTRMHFVVVTKLGSL